MDKNARNRKFITAILLIISLIIVVVLSMFLLDTTGKVNQGYFRINDLVVSSTIIVEDEKKTESEVDIYADNDNQVINSLADLTLDVSQKNEILFLIAKAEGIDAEKIYIDNVKVDYPSLTENMFIYQDASNMINLKLKDIKLDLVKEDRDGQYLIRLNVDNINFLRDATVPDTELNSINFDGTILNVLNTDISNITFNINFNLNIIDSIGKLNICKVDLKMPSKLLATNGISIISEDVGNFPFIVK